MKIRMLANAKGAPEGTDTREFVVGEVVELRSQRGLDLAGVFIREGWAEELVEARTAPAAPELEAPSLGLQAEEHLDEAEAERRGRRRRGRG